MNLNDIQGAIEDMLETQGAKTEELVYILQPDGSYKTVNGFHRGEDGRIYIT